MRGENRFFKGWCWCGKEKTSNPHTRAESCKEKLAESSKLLDSNHQVITWLNKEINETQLGRVSAYGEATQSGIENKYVPSYTPELKVSKGLGAYISPEAGKY